MIPLSKNSKNGQNNFFSRPFSGNWQKCFWLPKSCCFLGQKDRAEPQLAGHRGHPLHRILLPHRQEIGVQQSQRKSRSRSRSDSRCRSRARVSRNLRVLSQPRHTPIRVLRHERNIRTANGKPCRPSPFRICRSIFGRVPNKNRGAGSGR